MLHSEGAEIPPAVARASATMPFAETAHTCPACYSSSVDCFHEADDVPANSCILFDSEAAAKTCPTGRIRLESCRDCGFIYNSAFNSQCTEYSGRYEETQGFSETFSRFHTDLARRLISKHGLDGKTVLEIGCGKGEFLTLLAELGGNRGIGIDPGVHARRVTSPAAGQLQFIADFYSQKFGQIDVDFLVCKMTLEHIPAVEEFISTIRGGLGERTDTVVFFQIPETLRVLRECAFEDIYHEHCSYFTPGSLGRLFRRCGFDVSAIETEYGGQYLTIEARPRPLGSPEQPQLDIECDHGETARLVSTFPARYADKIADWRRVLDTAHAEGRSVALWGSGSKAVAFLKAVDPDRRIRYVADINPYRQGHFMPLSGQPILSPSGLVDARPDMVIVMNRIYETEIRASLASLGHHPELRSL